MVTEPQPAGQHGLAQGQIVGGLVIAFFGLCFLVKAAEFLRPARLVMTPQGLAYESVWRRQTWAWRDLGPFDVERLRYSASIRFAIASAGVFAPSTPGVDRRGSIPAGWRGSIDDVCAQLNAARARWR